MFPCSGLVPEGRLLGSATRGDLGLCIPMLRTAQAIGTPGIRSSTPPSGFLRSPKSRSARHIRRGRRESVSTLLIVERRGESVLLTLNRPERRNALSVALRDELSDALDALVEDDSVKAVVITGAGDVFSAGFDLGEFERAMGDPGFASALWASSDRYHATLAGFPLPTIAAVNGPAVGGGFDLAVLCDLRIASNTARFSHPERAFGDVVYAPLCDLVGGALARELTIGGREISAEEALGIHLVTEVVEPAGLPVAIEALLARVCVAPARRAHAPQGQSAPPGWHRPRSQNARLVANDPERLVSPTMSSAMLSPFR